MKKTVFIAALALSSSAFAASETKMTIMINSGEAMTQGAALVLGNSMLDRGASVNFLLCDKAGSLALKDAQAPVLKPLNKSPVQLLQEAMDKGASAQVCALYLPNVGKTPADLAEDITPAKPPKIAEDMLKHGVLVF